MPLARYFPREPVPAPRLPVPKPVHVPTPWPQLNMYTVTDSTNALLPTAARNTLQHHSYHPKLHPYLSGVSSTPTPPAPCQARLTTQARASPRHLSDGHAQHLSTLPLKYM